MDTATEVTNEQVIDDNELQDRVVAILCEADKPMTAAEIRRKVGQAVRKQTVNKTLYALHGVKKVARQEQSGSTAPMWSLV